MLTKTFKNLFLLVALSTVLFSFSKPVYNTNFAGTWALNEGKSELGQFGARAAASKLVVEQKTTDVTVSRTSTNFNGEPFTTTEALTADGKEVETSFGPAKKKSSLKWAADGNTLTVSYTIVFDNGGQNFELKGSETWTLSADGKALTLQVSLTTPNGDVSTKAVYDKQ